MFNVKRLTLNAQVTGKRGGNKPSMSDEQYYDYVKTKCNPFSHTPLKEQIRLTQAYLASYPKGKHTGEIIALFESAKAEFDSTARAYCVACLRQIQGAIEQAQISGIPRPTASDIYGRDKYLRERPHCPLDETKDYIITPSGPACPNNGPGHVLPKESQW
jgi:hypothetical protein